MDPSTISYVTLLHHRKCDSILVSGERQDILVRSGFLGEELVTGKCDDYEPTTFVLFIKTLQFLVLRRESAMGRRIDDE